MSVFRNYLCAIPAPYWDKELNGIDVAQFAKDALGCEQRITKQVNLENEYPRYTLLCQQLGNEVIRSGRMHRMQNDQDFQKVLDSGRFPIQAFPLGYPALLTRCDETTHTWRLGAGFYTPDEVAHHMQAFETWATEQGIADTPVVQHRLTFLEWASKAQCGVVELQSGFHIANEAELATQKTYIVKSDKEDIRQFVDIPAFVISGNELRSFGDKGKQNEARLLHQQIQDALKNGEPVNFGNQAKHDVITEVLHGFVFVPPGEALQPVELRIIYADGSEAAPFPLFCLPQTPENHSQPVEPLRMALMSMRHLELDTEIDYCWFRNREVSRTRTLSETDQFCYATTLDQLSDSLKLGDMVIHMFHTGFEPAVIGFYRGVVKTLVDLHECSPSPTLAVAPFYFRGPHNPYEQGRPWQ